MLYEVITERATPFVPEDMEKIEARMREIAEKDLEIERREMPREEAIAFFAGQGSYNFV